MVLISTLSLMTSHKKMHGSLGSYDYLTWRFVDMLFLFFVFNAL
jgi:hypothetical protein